MSAPAVISTLSEFLLQAQTRSLIFDLGRGIRRVQSDTFFEWENQQSPCAFPRQDHAWFCIAFWNEKLSTHHYIWFIKLPLDENGLIISASLQQFLDIIAQALGTQLQHTQDTQAQLPQNPYVFTPSQQQLADCNAHIKKALGLELVHNEKTIAYLQAPNAIDDNEAWAALSLQDIADFVIHPHYQTQSASQAIIAKNLAAYAPAVQNCLFASLESVEVGEVLSQALIQFHEASVDANLAALCLRAMSCKPQRICDEYLHQMINSHADCDAHNDAGKANAPLLSIDTCVVIAGRYWHVLNNDKNLALFMHQVALVDSSFQLFKGLYTDLVKIPETRNTMLRFVRNPQRTQEVSMAIGALFAST